MSFWYLKHFALGKMWYVEDTVISKDNFMEPYLGSLLAKHNEQNIQ